VGYTLGFATHFLNIFWQMVLPRDTAIKNWFIFPLHLNNVYALPGKTQTMENDFFSIKRYMALCEKTRRTHRNYYLVMFELIYTFIKPSTACTTQDQNHQEMEQSIQWSVMRLSWSRSATWHFNNKID